MIQLQAIRPFEERDYPAAVAAANAVYPDYPWSEAEWRHEDARYDGRRFQLYRIVAEEPEGGQIVGAGEYHHMPGMYHPQKLWVDLFVRPDFQGRRIGARLYDMLMEAARPLHPIVLWSNARETFPRSRRFLADRGFREIRRAWESRLDVAAFDPTPLQARAAAARRLVAVTTVADVRRHDPNWLPKLYQMHNEVAADVPQPEPYTPLSKTEYIQRTLEHPDYIPDAHFLAVAGDDYAGESYMFGSQSLPDVLYQALTATRRAYRGNGVALALKLSTIDYARRRGYREIRTWNDSLNEPMLRVNTRLGFVRQPAWITFEKRLER